MEGHQVQERLSCWLDGSMIIIHSSSKNYIATSMPDIEASKYVAIDNYAVAMKGTLSAKWILRRRMHAFKPIMP